MNTVTILTTDGRRWYFPLRVGQGRAYFSRFLTSGKNKAILVSTMRGGPQNWSLMTDHVVAFAVDE